MSCVEILILSFQECLEKCGESLQEIVNYHMVRHISLGFALHGHMSHNKTHMHKFQSEVIMIHHVNLAGPVVLSWVFLL